MHRCLRIGPPLWLEINLSVFVQVTDPSHQLTAVQRLHLTRLDHLKELTPGLSLQLVSQLTRGVALIQRHLVLSTDQELSLAKDMNQRLHSERIPMDRLFGHEVMPADGIQHEGLLVGLELPQFEVRINYFELISAVD